MKPPLPRLATTRSARLKYFPELFSPKRQENKSENFVFQVFSRTPAPVASRFFCRIFVIEKNICVRTNAVGGRWRGAF